jgi:hypothetical protein
MPQTAQPPEGRHARSIASRQAAAARRTHDLAPVIADLRAAGAGSARKLAAGLNAKGIPAPGRRGPWSPMAAWRVAQQLEALPRTGSHTTKAGSDTTVNGRIISLSSCERMWQCQT